MMLSEVPDRIAYSSPSVVFDLPIAASPARDQIRLPKVTSTQGGEATLFRIIGAIGVEFRLLRAERSLLLFLPVVIFFSFFSVPFSRIASEASYSVIAATNTTNSLLLCFACMIVFYMGEIMHRDREVKIEPVVWSTPAPNSVLLLSKCLAMTLLALSLAMLGGATAICAQMLRGYTPVDLSAYFIINGVVVVPSIIFMTAMVVALNVLLRNKYVSYVIAVGTGAGLFYLYSIGYNHWLYNPLLYKLWTYADLTTPTILAQRLYCLALAAACLVLAHVFFERKS
jgi:ABC-type transport system involved in multi-copper enzyme maturation permease subunit